MGTTQLKKPEQASNYSQHMSTIEKLPQATKAQTASAAAANCLRIGEILEIMRGSRPPEGDPKRAVYDAALEKLGKGSAADAISALSEAHVASIRRMNELVKQREDVGSSANAVEAMLAKVDAGIGAGEADYIPYEAIGNEIATLLRIVRGGEAEAAPTKTDKAVSSEPLPLIQTNLRDPGPITLLSSKQNETVVALNAASTPEMNLVFGGEANATAATNALANAYATVANHPNDLSAQQAAARTLHDALSNIPSGSELWNSENHPHFNAAMQALARGDLQTGLNELSQETMFNNVYGQLNNLYVISINQRAISVLRGGVTVRYEFDQNQDAFTSFIRGSAQGSFEPRLLWMALGLYYDHLLISGQLRQLQVNQGAGTVSEVSRRPVTGTGDVITVTPQVAMGFSAWSHPVEVVFHCSVGYQSYEIGADVPSAGATERVESKSDGMVVGRWGAQINFPGKEGQRMMVRMSQVGIGAVGNPLVNAYANVTFEGRWYEGNKLRIRSEVTPQYARFLEQHRIGADIRPADFTIQTSRNFSLFFGPGFTAEQNASAGITTLNGYGVLGMDFQNAGVRVDLRGGWVGERGGEAGMRVPDSPYGALNITVTPQRWFEKDKKISGETVPRKRKK